MKRNERGDVTTEAVIVTPVLLLLIMSVIQFALWYHAAGVAHAAAQEGARAASAVGASVSDGQNTAQRFVDQLGPTILNDTHISTNRYFDTANVRVDATAIALIPGLRLPIKAEVSNPVERFRAPA